MIATPLQVHKVTRAFVEALFADEADFDWEEAPQEERELMETYMHEALKAL